MSTTATLLSSLSLLLVVAVSFGLTRVFRRPAAQRTSGQAELNPGAENVSRLLVAIFALSALAAVAAVIWRFVS